MSELAIIFYKTVKHNSSCVICHSPSPQFHHVCPEDKIAEIHKVAKGGDLEATIAEFNKCIPLCQPHHSGVHKGVIPGYLRGQYDNGKSSDDWYAKPFMPYLNHFAAKKKHVLLKFYEDNIDREHRALLPLFNAAGLSLPRSLRLRVVVGGLPSKPLGGLGSTVCLPEHHLRTSDRQQAANDSKLGEEKDHTVSELTPP